MLVILCSFLSFAQSVRVSAYTDKSKVLLGEPFWLTLETKTLKDKTVASFKIDSIPHFQIIKKDSLQKTNWGDTLIVRQYFQLTSFDSGRWAIPPIVLRPFVRTNSVLIDVVYSDGFNPDDPYSDVKELQEIPFQVNSTIEKWWYGIVLILIVLVLIIYFLTGNTKQKSKEPAASSNNAYKKAIKDLNLLQQSNVEGRLYCFQLVDIFRTYLLERTGISSMQQTSTELMEKTNSLFEDKTLFNRLSQVLGFCDLVKFAKYNPSGSELSNIFDSVKKSIEYIEKVVKEKKYAD